MTRTPHAPRALATLALLLVCAQRAPAGPLPARALVDSVAARYAHLARYRFEGTTRTSVAGGTLPSAISMDMAFEYAARLPSRLHYTMDSPGNSSTLVADGDSMWVWTPDLHQYMVQKAPRLEPDSLPEGMFAAMLQPLQALVTLARGIESAHDAGRDTVHVGNEVVHCRRIVLAYPPDSVGGSPHMLPRTLWVDESHRLVVRDSITLEIPTAQAGRVLRTQDMRFARRETGDGGPDSLYRFAVPEGARRVRRFGTEPPPNPLVGKPSIDFTLPALAGSTVTLSALRGRVVVLDFWATWCGPCRRWMPIVAKWEQKLQATDVAFYAVNLAETPEKVNTFLRTAGRTPPILLDRDGRVANLYGAASIPLTVVIGRDGKVVEALVGVHPEEDLVDALHAAGVKDL